jgi:DNA repair protein RadD
MNEQPQLDFTHHSGDGNRPTCRDYQIKALEDSGARLLVNRAVIAVAPTGSGKTVIAAEFINQRPESNFWFLAPRRELIHQTCRKLDDVAIKYGVLLAGDKKRTNLYARVQVMSVDTLLSRLIRRKSVRLSAPDYIIVDEAHVGLTARRQQIFDMYPDAKILGFTATPCRSDGKSLGRVYNELVLVSSTRELTERGYLVPARYFSVSKPDLKKVRTTGGDFNLKDLAEVTNTAKLVGDVVAHWQKHANNRRTVVFNVDIEHSAAVAQRFQLAGVKAEHVDANTDQRDRDAIFSRFASGDTQVLCNCTLASIGFDLPELDCVVLNRATKSLGLYLQMLGRGLRPFGQKKDCLVLDHAGNVHRHGFAADERAWTLSGTDAIDPERQAKINAAKKKADLKQLTCPQCKCVWEGSVKCPSCGYTFPPKAVDRGHMQGSLVEIMDPVLGKFQLPPASSSEWTITRKIDFYSQLVGIGMSRGYKPMWASCKYKDKFNEWPAREWLAPILKNGPTRADVHVINWVVAGQRAWIRKKRKYEKEQAELA